jgi:hypothetical protein
MMNIEFRDGYDLGVGIDTVTGNPLGDPVLRTEPEELMNAEGQTTTFFMQQVESTDELNDMLSTSAEVSARYGFFSGSASFNFATSSNIQRYSMFLLVTAVVTNSFRQMRDVRLAKHAVDMWARGDTEAWLAANGDAYCRGVSTGGVLNIVLRIDTESEEEKQELLTEVNAGMNVGVAGFDASAQFEQMMGRLSAKKTIHLNHIQMGGDQKIEYTPEKILEKAALFAKSVKGNLAIPFSILASPYTTVTNLPPTPNKFDRLLAKDVITECGRLRLNYLDWINDIDYVLSHPQQFDWGGQKNKKAKALNKKADDLRRAITALARRASRCADDVNECAMPSGEETVHVPPDIIPNRRKKTNKPSVKPKPNVGAMGGLTLGGRVPKAVPIKRKTNVVAASLAHAIPNVANIEIF